MTVTERKLPGDARSADEVNAVWKDRDEFITELKDALRKAGLTKPPAPLINTIWSTIGEHDDDATIVTDSKGNPEPDPALRDIENVPLTEDIEGTSLAKYCHTFPDAWIDHNTQPDCSHPPTWSNNGRCTRPALPGSFDFIKMLKMLRYWATGTTTRIANQAGPVMLISSGPSHCISAPSRLRRDEQESPARSRSQQTGFREAT
jgi:hypothetical protein